jgi:hypothetical protein
MFLELKKKEEESLWLRVNVRKICQGEISFIFCAFPLNFECNLFVLHLACMNPPIYIYIYMKNIFFLFITN